jgi:predicted XRE-type DNA-binding protein
MESGCHEWQSTLHRDGYGKFYYEGKQAQAHRVAYTLFKGKPDQWVLHKCDNRKCVNPEHLFLGDAQANISDMDGKGRRGSKAKLTFDQCEEIKRLYAQRYSQECIGKMFGVDQTTVSRVVLSKLKMFKH